MSYQLCWTTDPHSPEYGQTNKKLLQTLEKFEAKTIKKDLGAGLFNYTSFLSENLLLSNPLGSVVFEYIDEISFEPLSLSIHTKDPIIIESQYSIAALNQIIKTILKKILYIEITNISVNKFLLNDPLKKPDGQSPENKFVIFNPETDNGPIFLASSEISTIKRQCNLNEFLGYSLLSEDPLGLYVLEKYNMSKSNLKTYFLEAFGYNILLIKTNFGDEMNFQDCQNYIDDFNLNLENLRNEGYFPIVNSILATQDDLLIVELTELWETKYIKSIGQTQVLFCHEDKTSWILNSLISIKQDLLPLSYAKGPWISSYPSIINQAKTQYGAILTMINLTIENLNLLPYISKVKVLDNLNIVGYFSRHQDLISFENKLELLMRKSFTWSILEVDLKSPDKYIALREDLYNKYPNSHPIFVRISSPPKSSPNENLTTPRLFLVVDTLEPINLKSLIDDIDPNPLKQKLIKYYSEVCKGQEDALLKIKISDMSITEMLKLIVSDQGKNGYCFSDETFLRLNSLYNPLTSLPFSRNVLFRASLVDESIDGLYSIGPLKGLIPKIYYPETPIYKGKVILTIIDQIIDVSIELPEGRILPLFIIWDQNVTSKTFSNDLKKIITKLWHRGYFSTSWANSYNFFSPSNSKISTLVPRRNDILSNAGENLESGIKAFNYLKSIV